MCIGQFLGAHRRPQTTKCVIRLQPAPLLRRALDIFVTNLASMDQRSRVPSGQSAHKARKQCQGMPDAGQSWLDNV